MCCKPSRSAALFLFGLLVGLPVVCQGVEPPADTIEVTTEITISSGAAADPDATKKAADAAAAATHRESGRTVLRDTAKGRTLQTFCLGNDGRVYGVVAKSFYDGAAATDLGEIRVLNAKGEEVAKWATTFTPQRIAAAPDGSIVVGGFGKVARYSAEGKLIAETASPHLAAVMGDKASLRKAAEAQHAETIAQYEEQIKQFDEQIKGLEEQAKAEKEKQEQAKKKRAEAAGDKNEKQGAKPDANESGERQAGTFFGIRLFSGSAPEQSADHQLRQFQQMRKSYGQMLDQQKKMSIEDVENQIAARLQRIHGIAAGDDVVYVATAMAKGYGYAVWRMNREFGDAKQIVSGLSGCCGQIDVQARGDELFVAENARHRVVRYDNNGKQLAAWGKRDREGAGGGFGGCCNPMNLCFTPDGSVVTSESEGLMKCFSAKGDFVGLMGSAKVSGGCKNVAVAVSPDGKRAYFYDQVGSQIILFERSDSAEPPKKPEGDKQAKLRLM
jgi:hypothetical protein